MTGPWHYQKAEALLEEAAHERRNLISDGAAQTAAAHAHATLALAAATALNDGDSGMPMGDYSEWAKAASTDGVGDIDEDPF